MKYLFKLLQIYIRGVIIFLMKHDQRVSFIKQRILPNKKYSPCYITGD